MSGPIYTVRFTNTDGTKVDYKVTKEQYEQLLSKNNKDEISIFMEQNNLEKTAVTEESQANMPTIAQGVEHKEGEKKMVTVDKRRPESEVNAAKERVEKMVYFAPDQKDEYEAFKNDSKNANETPVLLTENDMKTIEKNERLKSAVTTDENGKKTIESGKLKSLSKEIVGEDYYFDTSEREGGLKERRLFEHLGYDVQRKHNWLTAAGAALLALGAAETVYEATTPKTEYEIVRVSSQGEGGGTAGWHDEEREVSVARKILGWIPGLLGAGLMGLGKLLDRPMKKEEQTESVDTPWKLEQVSVDCNCDDNAHVQNDKKYEAEVHKHETEEDTEGGFEVYKLRSKYHVQGSTKYQGDTLASVLKAKYNIKNSKDLKDAIRAVRVYNHLQANGKTADGKTAIPFVEQNDGTKLRDAYKLPKTLKIGNTTYNLNIDADVSPNNYNLEGVAVKVPGASVSRNASGYYTVHNKETGEPINDIQYRRKEDAQAAAYEWQEKQNAAINKDK